MSEMLNGIKKATNSNAKFTWVNADFLTAHNVRPWSDMPVWVAPRGDQTGFTKISVKKAVSKGLTYRTVGDTTQATLAWFKKQTAERQAALKSGIKPEREKEVLSLWHASQT